MQTTAAMLKAATLYGAETQPRARKVSDVIRSVATVMPEMGLEELPTSPVSRELTVVKRKPSTSTRVAPRTLILNDGTKAQTTTMRMEPAPTTHIGMSRSVRSGPALAVAPLNDFMPRITPPTMVGRDFASEMIPPAATAPAPIYRIY